MKIKNITFVEYIFSKNAQSIKKIILKYYC